MRLALEEQRRRLEAEYAALERGRAGNEDQEVPPLARITIDNMVDIVQRQRRCVEELLAAVGRLHEAGAVRAVRHPHGGRGAGGGLPPHRRHRAVYPRPGAKPRQPGLAGAPRRAGQHPGGHRLPVAGGAGGGVHRGSLGSAGQREHLLPGPAAPPPTVERRLSDLDELVDALWARYGRDRLFLLGHSWGSLLGGLYALRRPEKLSAWLPVSQMVDFKRSEQVSAAEAIRRARGAGREEDAERLAQELEQVLALRRLDRAGGPEPCCGFAGGRAVSAAPVRQAVSAGGTGRPGADRKRPAVEAPL
ncbi:MAG: alpha/beta fold hydrolase [Flavonifractor plautii]